MSLAEPVIILPAVHFAIALTIGLGHGRYLLSALAYFTYLALSPTLIYGASDVVLAIGGYFVSGGGL